MISMLQKMISIKMISIKMNKDVIYYIKFDYCTSIKRHSDAESYIVCFQEVPPTVFLDSVEEDLTATDEVKLVKDISDRYILFDTSTTRFFKFYDRVKEADFAKYAIDCTLNNGVSFKKIDWNFKLLTQKELFKRMFRRFLNDINSGNFSRFYS